MQSVRQAHIDAQNDEEDDGDAQAPILGSDEVDGEDSEEADDDDEQADASSLIRDNEAFELYNPRELRFPIPAGVSGEKEIVTYTKEVDWNDSASVHALNRHRVSQPIVFTVLTCHIKLTRPSLKRYEGRRSSTA